MTQSFEDCDWLVVQEGNKRALLRVGFIISLHFEIYRTLSLSLSHTHYICIYILYFLFTMLSYLMYFIGNEQRHNKVLKVLEQTQIIAAAKLHFFQLPNMLVNVVITSISGAMAFLRSVRDVSVSLVRSVTNTIPARSNVQRLINSLSCIVCKTFLHVSSIFSTAKKTLKPLKSPRSYS